jgi:hydroxymethylglutaryl-CoA lyase
MGVKTGVNIDALVDIGEWISKTLNRKNESRAGAAIAAKRTPTNPEPSPSTTSTDHLLVTRTPSTATITLNNPSKGNVLNASMVTSLRTKISQLSSDPSLQTIILTNTGKWFCTGMDLSSSGPATSGSTKDQLQTMQSTFECINTCPKTTIAVICGGCFGGGVGLVFCCDIRIVVGPQKFVLSEVKRGLVPATISKYIVREWGASLAREAMITGRAVTASELLRHGVVHAVVDTDEEAMRKVDEYVEMMGTSAPRAVGQVKSLVNAVAERKEEGQEIERVFEDMMRPSEEAGFGIGEFRRGVKGIDWGKWYRELGGKSKL